MPDSAAPIDYATPHAPDQQAAWRLLRIAVILWASLVLLRHATYWGGIWMDERSPSAQTVRTSPNSVRVISNIRVTDSASLPGSAAYEAIALLAALGVAIACPAPSSRAVGILRLAAIAFLAVVVVDYIFNLRATWPDTPPNTRELVRRAWQLISRAQLWVVPILCIIGIRR